IRTSDSPASFSAAAQPSSPAVAALLAAMADRSATDETRCFRATNMAICTPATASRLTSTAITSTYTVADPDSVLCPRTDVTDRLPVVPRRPPLRPKRCGHRSRAASAGARGHSPSPCRIRVRNRLPPLPDLPPPVAPRLYPHPAPPPVPR